LSATLTFGVGGLFDFLSGRIPRAPEWLRKAGLEWTYRLYQEPGRMWRRYILGNPEFVARAAIDALPGPSELLKRVDLAATRALGFSGAALGLFLLSPLLIFVAMAIRFTSEGPAILRQTRIGKDGVPFQLYKFRSMYVDADQRRAALLAQNRHGADCVTFKMAHDPRVTPLGRFLRRSSIDELPQLLNVLGGSMALVGPRPPLPDEVSRYTPHQHGRLAGKPGLTCLWQVNGRANLPFPKQVELDIEYLTHRNLLMDVLIVLRTIPAVLFARGAY
jgi:lipopolysaccharide/colanic/teichoic acid biosynthesis glycosyltransferase